MLFTICIMMLVAVFQTAFGQGAEGCDQAGRYLLPVFSQVQQTNVVYGSNRTANGQNRVLSMDIFEPVGDAAAARPVIIWVHGGSFIFGSRTDMRVFAETYARLGYVTASIDYRLFPISLGIPDSTKALDAAIKAVGDLKAAVRHLRRDAETDNRFRIDPDRILIGGLSAGAITAVHAAYLSEDDDIPAHVQAIVDANGGIHGSTGDSINRSYSSEVLGVISMSGAIYDERWISASDPPLVSFHAKDDDVVPYYDDFARIGGLNIIRLKGSGIMYERAEDIGLSNYHLGPDAGGHNELYTSPAYEAERLEFTAGATAFVRELICDQTVSLSTRELREPAIFPVPADEGVRVDLGAEFTGQSVLQLYDLAGRLQTTVQAEGAAAYIPRGDIPAGMYILRVDTGTGAEQFAPVRLLFR